MKYGGNRSKMNKYFDLIDKANDLDELTEIVEERAAFDDGITNKEYCEIVEYANIKIKNWRNGNEKAICCK